jgi:hypothetical protein
MSRSRVRALALALCAARVAAQLYSPLLPAFRCARQDAACASLGDLYGATSGGQWRNNTGWLDAAAGTPTDYCVMAGVNCTAGVITQMCVRHSGGGATWACGKNSALRSADADAACAPLAPQSTLRAAAAGHAAGLAGRHHVAPPAVRAPQSRARRKPPHDEGATRP